MIVHSIFGWLHQEQTGSEDPTSYNKPIGGIPGNLEGRMDVRKRPGRGPLPQATGRDVPPCGSRHIRKKFMPNDFSL
jgi:hypothetical protein